MINFRNCLFFLFLLAGLTACETEDFTPFADEETQLGSEEAPAAMSQMYVLVNQLRQKGCQCGSNYMPPVGPVSWNPDLDAAALRHARDMQTNDFFDHVGSDGTEVSDRVSDTGYSWQTVGENIAWGHPSMTSVFEGWRDSPGHCRNLMNANFRHMGMARAGKYWVQDFAMPRGN